MKNQNIIKAKDVAKNARREQISQRLLTAANTECELLLKKSDITLNGLNQQQIENNREAYGINQITERKNESLFVRLVKAYINPFTVILFILVLISIFTDVIFVDVPDWSTIIIISTMVILSGTLRFVQEARSGKAAEKLKKMVHITTAVMREGEKQEIPLKDVVVGDIIHLAAGDMVPADMRVISAKDLHVGQSSLTGESEPIEKLPAASSGNNPLEMRNLVFLGTNVVSGSAVCLVVATGDDTYFGNMAQEITGKRAKTSFEKGINSVSWVLIRFMAIMVPVIFLVNGITKGIFYSGGGAAWIDALLFGLAIAVGLTPEMLPMIVTTGLAKGAVSMAKKKVVVKNLNAIQNLGAMDVFCTDKTGTLTQDKVVLENYYDVHGNENNRVLRHAFLNSYYQTGLKNLIDVAIISHSEQKDIIDLCKGYEKVDEIPFDFSRRRMSVVVEKQGKRQMITKGAVEEMLSICRFAEYENAVIPLTDELKSEVLERVKNYNQNGLRVLAVAQKTNPSAVGVFSVTDESDMVLIGYLAFLDPPKTSAKTAIKGLTEYGVTVKVLTGDNDAVTQYICRQVGMDARGIILGSDVQNYSDEELNKVVEENNIFAKLSPSQKSRIVRALRNNGHTVGFMGDGINDAAAMKESDVGISVDTAVDIAKESADIILLEKDLTVLEEGIIEGRKTFGNIIKYIKMTASSNFGNMFSMLVAGVFLPFLPMLPLQLLMLNLIYDISCIAVPWDRMDKEFLLKPRKWDAKGISKFMIWIGPTSSVFDITTYALMFFVICPAFFGGSYKTLNPETQLLFMAMFQTGWFVESLWSQTLVIHMIRTPKIPFIQSRASLTLTIFTALGIIVGTIIPQTPIAEFLGMHTLPWTFYPWLIATIAMYMMLATLLKKLYIKKYGELL